MASNAAIEAEVSGNIVTLASPLNESRAMIMPMAIQRLEYVKNRKPLEHMR